MTLYYTRYNKILHILFYSNLYDKILHPLTQNTAHPLLLEFVWQYTTTKYVSNFNVITLFLILPSITSAITTSYSLPCQRVPNSVLSPTIVHFITTSSHFNLHNLLPNNLVFYLFCKCSPATDYPVRFTFIRRGQTCRRSWSQRLACFLTLRRRLTSFSGNTQRRLDSQSSGIGQNALCVTYPVQCQVIGPTSSLASNESVTSLARRLGARFTW